MTVVSAGLTAVSSTQVDTTIGQDRITLHLCHYSKGTYLHCIFTLYIYIVYLHCIFRLYIYIVYLHCVFTLY